MSNFQDNFHREEEKVLDYDDSAFYYFFISVLTVFLVPFTYHIVKTVVLGEKKFELTGRNCQCSRCTQIISKRKDAYKHTWIRPGFFIKVAIALFCWFLWYLTADQISRIKPLKSFDPYQILGVEPGAEPNVIKKAYRKLSLIKHPDKNPDDPLAVTEFIQITKAYTTLTDDAARENWEKYGNPDGPGSFQVAIALPSFLLQKEYSVSVLAAFFFVLLILIPAGFYYNLDSTNQDLGGVSVENRRIYAYLINENLIVKNCPTILACSQEYQNMKVKSQAESDALANIKKDDFAKELIPKVQGKMAEILSMQTLCILLGYMLRMDEINASVQEDLEYILSKCPYQLEQMIQMAMVLGMQFKMGQSRKRVTAKNVLTIIGFSQNLIQGMWQDDDPFLQLPHMNYDKLKALRKKQKSVTLENYCAMTRDQRQSIGVYEDPKEFEDSEKSIVCFPLIDMKIEYFVDGEKDIAVGDILTIKLIITHMNLSEKEQLGFVHSNKFPFLKQSSWYLVFTDEEENDFFAMEKLVIKEKVFVKEIKERLTRPGKMSFCMILRNDSYRGFDKKISLEIDVLKDVKREAVEYNEEDIQAQKAPSLMQQMMEMQTGADSDDDEEEEEETANTKQQTPSTPHEKSVEGETKKDK